MLVQKILHFPYLTTKFISFCLLPTVDLSQEIRIRPICSYVLPTVADLPAIVLPSENPFYLPIGPFHFVSLKNIGVNFNIILNLLASLPEPFHPSKPSLTS